MFDVNIENVTRIYTKKIEDIKNSKNIVIILKAFIILTYNFYLKFY